MSRDKRYDPKLKRWVEEKSAKNDACEEKPIRSDEMVLPNEFQGFKYNEDEILQELSEHLTNTYGEHYNKNNEKIECFDAWIALGDSGPTFRNTALKYLWRYGNKDGHNKKDLLKAMHYIQMLIYVDHYKDRN